MRRTGMELLDPGKTALLVIDVQVGLFTSDPPPDEAGSVLENIGTLLRKARQANVLVVFLQHDGTEEDGVEPGTNGWELHPALDVQPRETVLRKTTCDAFFRTDLEKLLRDKGIETLILAGYATDFCIDSTLRNAMSKDFEVVVASDTHTTNDGPVLAANQVRAHFNWAWENCTTERPVKVVPTRSVSFEVMSRA